MRWIAIALVAASAHFGLDRQAAAQGGVWYPAWRSPSPTEGMANAGSPEIREAQAPTGGAGADQKQQQAVPSAPTAVPANQDVQAAYQFVQRQLTIDTSILGAPEPGLSRVQMIVEGDMCRLRCGSHLAISSHDVADLESEFAMKDVAISTLTWQIDRHNRAFVSFGSTLGTSVFRYRTRTRKVDVISLDQKPLSDWTKWSEWKTADKIECRAKMDKDSLRRTLRAMGVLAESCGARATPF